MAQYSNEWPTHGQQHGQTVDERTRQKDATYTLNMLNQHQTNAEHMLGICGLLVVNSLAPSKS